MEGQPQQQGPPSHKELLHPETLLDRNNFLNPQQELKRRDLNQKKEAFIVDNVLTKDECIHYIQECERVGFESLEALFPQHYRSNDRIITLSHPIASSLFHRILPLLNPSGRIMIFLVAFFETLKQNNNKTKINKNK